MWRNPKAGLLLSILMAASVWFYVQRVLIPYQKADAALHARPRGILSDLYPRWLGTRELLLHHRDPYSPEITREIQTGYYGRPLDPQRPEDPRDEQRFAYPIYVAFLLAPTIGMPFAIVQTAGAWVLAFSTGASVWLWLWAMRWQPSRAVIGTVLVLTVGSFAALQGIKLQQLSLLVAAFMAGAAAALAAGYLVLAGVLLAIASIKPQLVVLPAGWLCLWALSNWKERRNFLLGFLLSGLLLVAAGAYLLPGWLGEFFAGLSAYNRYTGGRSLLDDLTTPRLGAMLAVLLLIGAAVVCWKWRRAPAGSNEFNFALALALAVTVVVAPMIAPYNHLLLLPAVLLIARSRPGFWRRSRPTQVLWGGAGLIFFWSWLASLGLMLASTLWPASSVQQAWAVPLWSSLAVPLVVLGLLLVCIIDSAKGQRAA